MNSADLKTRLSELKKLTLAKHDHWIYEPNDFEISHIYHFDAINQPTCYSDNIACPRSQSVKQLLLFAIVSSKPIPNVFPAL